MSHSDVQERGKKCEYEVVYKNIFLDFSNFDVSSATLTSVFRDCLRDSEEEFLCSGHGDIEGVGVFVSLLSTTERGEVLQVRAGFDLIAEAG